MENSNAEEYDHESLGTIYFNLRVVTGATH